MSDSSLRLYFSSPEHRARVQADIDMIRDVLHLSQTQAIFAALRLGALNVRQLAMRTGERTRIYPADDGTWTLQIGRDARNVVEGLPSAEAALNLIIKAP